MPHTYWLSEPLAYADYNGDWNSFIGDVYGQFAIDFDGGQVQLGGKRVRYRGDLEDGYPMGFWHVVSEKDRSTGERIPDFRRCERVAWVREIILNACSPEVRCWRNTRDGRERLLLWVPTDDNVVILEEETYSFKIVTAYCELKSGRRKQFETEWKAYKSKGAAPC